MKTIQKTVLIWYSPREMFDLVADVADYPEFLPWCERAAVLQTHDDGVSAQIGMRLGLVQQSFTTRNTHVLPESPKAEHAIRLALEQGPFSELTGQWKFTPIGKGADRACKVSLELRYAFASAALAGLMSHMFDAVASGLVDAFVARAQSVYGEAA